MMKGGCTFIYDIEGTRKKMDEKTMNLYQDNILYDQLTIVERLESAKEKNCFEETVKQIRKEIMRKICFPLTISE